jgi:hypothetical protein
VSTAWKAALACLALLALGFGVQTYRLHRAEAAGSRAAIAPAKEAAVAARAAERVAAQALDARVDTVTRWLTRTVHDTVPVALLHPTTPADTAAAVAMLPVVEARYQACRAQLVPLVESCAVYRVRTDSVLRADSVLFGRYEAALAHPAPPRRWSVGVTGGYGAVVGPGGRLEAGPAVVAGLTWRAF